MHLNQCSQFNLLASAICVNNLTGYFWTSSYELTSCALPVEMVWGERYTTRLMISQHCFKIMAWYPQTISHCLSQCWPTSISIYIYIYINGPSAIRPQLFGAHSVESNIAAKFSSAAAKIICGYNILASKYFAAALQRKKLTFFNIYIYMMNYMRTIYFIPVAHSRICLRQFDTPGIFVSWDERHYILLGIFF